MERLVVCSHRGPVAYVRNGGRLEPRRAGPGGLVAVLGPALRQREATWIFAPSTAADREIAADRRTDLADGNVAMRIVDLLPRAHADHYRLVSTQVLTPLFHYLLPLGTSPSFTKRLWRGWEGYRSVNEAYGRAIAAEASSEPVLVEDVFLLLAGAAARRAGARARLAYFHHIPWCEPDYFAVLPPAMRHEILASMLDYDCVGFHCTRWADAFSACCERFLPGASRSDAEVAWRGRRSRVLTSPAAIDASELTATAGSPGASDWRTRLSELSDGRTPIVRVERVDPQKNAVRGIRAFEQLLERRPELADTAFLLAILTPVREWIPEYRRYHRGCEAAAARVNRRFSASASRRPVHLHLSPDAHGYDHHRALAAMTLAHTLMVTSVYDGLNVVALEGVVVGAPWLVLSENAGVNDQLAGDALSIGPFDIVATADALERALTEPEGERVARAERMRRTATARTPHDWVRERLQAAGG